MAKLSADGKYVTVEPGDTLSEIAQQYGNGLTYTQLASINGVPNPDRLSIGQKIYLTGIATSEGTVSTGEAKSASTSNPTKVTIVQFGIQSNTENTLFVTWNWEKSSSTKNYAVEWHYDTGNGVWFVGTKTETEDQQSTYDIPDKALQVMVRIKPVSMTYESNGQETTWWTAEWSDPKIYNVADNPPPVPSVPTVTVENYTLTARVDNLTGTTHDIQFQIVKDDSTLFKTYSVTVQLQSAAYSCAIDPGHKYKVRCRARNKNGVYSEWTDYSGNSSSIPSAPASITTCRATSKSSVYLAWEASSAAETYDIEYATKREYLNGSNQSTTLTGIESTNYEVAGLETGSNYFFRVRAVNDSGHSAWSSIVSIVIGKQPSAPTTWSSTTTCIVGESLILYWVHNAEDGSSATYSELELIIDGLKDVKTLQNTAEEDEKDKTQTYAIDTKSYTEGTTIQWRVRTAGITKEYGDWSIQRTVDVYAPPTLELTVTDTTGEIFETLESFPIRISAFAGPKTQAPVGYHLSIISKQIYETVDNIGNTQVINKGDEVYSKYFDTEKPLETEVSASDVNLDNGMKYTLTCTVSMNSGLTAESSIEFQVEWTDIVYKPNASINYDTDAIVTHIHPYCEEASLAFYEVVGKGGIYDSDGEHLLDSNGESIYENVPGKLNEYVLTENEIMVGELVEGIPLETGKHPDYENVYTASGEQVFLGKKKNGEQVYYATVKNSKLVDGITLSVYRREFDGTYTELAVGVENSNDIFITDPHPALDYARYRIVAITKDTGAVGFYDVPGYSIGEKAVVIQWNEAWTNFETSEENMMEQPAWAGSLLKLPYNIDVSDKYDPDVSLVEYIGRSHPVSYYGTQVGETTTWKLDIPKNDKETLYSLRRLAIWSGDVYVREPSGTGYWASITVSLSQTHKEVIIPVTIEITRVEGGA